MMQNYFAEEQKLSDWKGELMKGFPQHYLKNQLQIYGTVKDEINYLKLTKSVIQKLVTIFFIYLKNHRNTANYLAIDGNSPIFCIAL